jgi:hypothetical protein
LIGQLVAAFNPYDLDAMDESVPLTKYTLDQLLGINHSGEDYRHYWTLFCVAQRQRPIQSKVYSSFYALVGPNQEEDELGATLSLLPHESILVCVNLG